MIELPICLRRQERRKSPGFEAPGLVGRLPWVGVRNGRSKKIRPFSQRDLSIFRLFIVGPAVLDQEVEHPAFGVLGPSALEGRGHNLFAALLNENLLNSEQSKTICETNRSRSTRGSRDIGAPCASQPGATGRQRDRAGAPPRE